MTGAKASIRHDLKHGSPIVTDGSSSAGPRRDSFGTSPRGSLNKPLLTTRTHRARPHGQLGVKSCQSDAPGEP